MRRPLLVVDGDSFAHRAYHALPKSIKRADSRPGNALVGFTNMLLRLWEGERPRTVLVAWDRLDVPTYRHTAFPAYQSGRVFDDGLTCVTPWQMSAADVDCGRLKPLPCGVRG